MALSSSFVCGVSAAIFAPFLMVLGFMIWDDHWTKKKGSAFSLNMYKCNLTALWFLIIIVTANIPDESGTLLGSDSALTPGLKIVSTKLNPFLNEDVKFLMASSTVGILIGDWTWIEGLKYLGARKVIVMDSLKPFLAALAGWVFFNEKFSNPLLASMGLVLTVVGVALVGLEVQGEEKQEEHEYSRIHDADNRIQNSRDKSNTGNGQNRTGDESNHYGLFMAISNVVLHTLGVTLTKKFGTDMTTWEINFVRFGFSGLAMLLLAILLHMRDRISKVYLESSQSFQSQSTDSTNSGTPNYGSLPTTANLNPASRPHSYNTGHRETNWYALPKLSRASWIRVNAGVLFVSFLNPALTNYAMFQIPLALLLTLESIGPLYSLPLAFVIHKEYPSIQSSVGAIFAVAGIALLSLQGNKDI